MLTRLFIAAAAACALAAPANAADAPIPYPENFRSFFHVKSMVILGGHPLADPFQGIHQVYANGKAMEGATGAANGRTGQCLCSIC